MPRNLELKARYPSLRNAARIARALGARNKEALRQTDTYFASAAGRRLKLREIAGQTAELISYRRPNRQGSRFSDYEKLAVRQASNVRAMLASALGIVCVVKKSRVVYIYHGARIHLDRVRGVGTYLEFEVPVGRNRDRANRLMRELVRRFRISRDSFVGSSYSDLLLTTRKGKR